MGPFMRQTKSVLKEKHTPIDARKSPISSIFSLQCGFGSLGSYLFHNSNRISALKMIIRIKKKDKLFNVA